MNRHDTLGAVGLDRRTRHRNDGDHRPPWRRALSLVFTVAVVAVAVYLWPAMLGGSTRLVIVSGGSMEPTYHLRDIVVARDAGNTRVGDVVVFEVPEGRAEGMLIIHRILEVDDEGFFVTQGDDRTTPDQWQLTEDDIVGKPLLHIPKGGKALGFIQNIWVIALLVGMVVLFLLWPDADDAADEPEEEVEQQRLDDTDSLDDTSLDDTDALDRDDFERDEIRITAIDTTPDELARRWLDSELMAHVPAEVDHGIDDGIDEDIMADALDWLDQQLARFEQPVAH